MFYFTNNIVKNLLKINSIYSRFLASESGLKGTFVLVISL